MSRPAPDPDVLVAEHLPLVGHVVAGLTTRLPQHVDRDELVSAGMFGLVQAAQAYDGARGVEFGAYATTRIRGAVLDELRSRDWATRSVRGLARQADAATAELTNALGRTPTPAEIAGRLGVDVAALTQLSADVERASLLSYEFVVLAGYGEGSTEASGSDPESYLLARERCSYLNDAVATLPERMRVVIEGLFFNEQTGAEIARQLNVTEARVSQIRSDALALLREGMHEHLELPASAAAQPSGPAAKRKAAYFAALGAASDFRSRLDAAPAEAAERVAATGI